MLEELLQAFDSDEFYEGVLVAMEDLNVGADSLSATLILRPEVGDAPATSWDLRVAGIREFHLESIASPDLSFCAEHPLLLRYCAEQTKLFFRGAPVNATEVLGALALEHMRVAGEWIPFDRHLRVSPSLLGGGFGLLAEGPAPLLDAYASVLERFHVTPSLTPRSRPRRWSGSAFDEESASLRVLLIGRTYVIADRFQAIQKPGHSVHSRSPNPA